MRANQQPSMLSEILVKLSDIQKFVQRTGQQDLRAAVSVFTGLITIEDDGPAPMMRTSHCESVAIGIYRDPIWLARNSSSKGNSERRCLPWDQ